MGEASPRKTQVAHRFGAVQSMCQLLLPLLFAELLSATPEHCCLTYTLLAWPVLVVHVKQRPRCQEHSLDVSVPPQLGTQLLKRSICLRKLAAEGLKEVE